MFWIAVILTIVAALAIAVIGVVVLVFLSDLATDPGAHQSKRRDRK
ncbi:hypothetical protein [Oryzicola mucosus]|uniref:Uncharacterized protein n=1 Tax=Oryzicola mucosus TaxID=2767425 RepID=A0A8J6U1M7_9HYPH|nr:hypothetical protein [Oryzicola mucosus]MBD0414643.1 hypothetical protein [Oryzicola mucosus]